VIWSATHNCHIPLLVIQKITYYRKASIDEFYDITGMDRFMVVTNGRMNSHKDERNRFTYKFCVVD
jgi:hypothetical protein